MPAEPNSQIAYLDGLPASAADLAPLAFAGYAHFTAMQVRDGRIRGLDLHLSRLRSASAALFGAALSDEQVRRQLRTALQAGPGDLSLTATVYSPEGEFTAHGTGTPRLLIRTGPPSSGPGGPLSLQAVQHERVLPGIKHVGEIAKTWYLRQAVAQGFDDAAFVDRQGRLSEGSIWNLAFWDGEAVVWPVAEMLTGTTMGIVQRQLDRLGIAQRTREIRLADLPSLSGAAVMNSWTPGVPARRIGPVAIADAPEFLALLHRAHRAEAAVAP
ncbi:Branched-chain amino acid aminotransferase/4-amino-4-deoxychorismate lyase [Cupriavidus gilardii CR3]|uniref:Aminotransferase class IV family protein n=1 Tax=Cupriavidus gilardii TaxID=82541 RepID=A0A849BFA9_9BURK|nr:aminotransferase class IV family protein [Cupriavidus gilardii]ALD89453.1 Branched-chain amino acid aminotransferase/4-amino-4-deoxychorismate lyase [Cupriavidus gilardii CR3]KAB0596759.1 aminotransferase class IV family protein [Cupriavidus gilardii]MCT9013584.1 aminotransferase class IV family protein [Cupriavidus gilardii]MCT9051771.1 aminotransferase class IV family protein [Cupriavidus gilardii]NNH12794.1 aminotransferase class IV family protein [Cupriavidus gilardii]